MIRSTDNRQHERSGAERGAALVMAMLLIAVLLLAGGTFLRASLTEATIATNEVDSTTALNLAEAGIAHARVLLAGQDVDVLLAAGGVLFDDRTLGRGTYTLTVSNNVAPTFPRLGIAADVGGASTDTDDLIVLTAVGEVGFARRSVEVIVRADAVASPDSLSLVHGSWTERPF